MCGIVGYIGNKRADGVLLTGLQRLEYRGYDSAGVAILLDGSLVVRKQKGKVSVLAQALESSGGLEGTLGIGHTLYPSPAPLALSSDIVLYDTATGSETVLGSGLEAHTDGRRVAWRTGTSAEADIVVSSRWLPRGCSPRWLKLDRDSLGRTGGVAVYLGKEPSAVTVAERIGRHPWAAGVPQRMRYGPRVKSRESADAPIRDRT